MKFVKLAIGVVLLGGLLAGTALSQTNMAYRPPARYGYQFAPAQRIAYARATDLLAAPGEVSASPSDAAVTPGGSISGGSCSSCNSCSGCCNPCSRCCLGAPWTLFGTTYSGITAGGWISAGGFFNEYGTPTNGTLGFNNVADGITMNQLWGFIDKPVNTGGYGWDVGGRIDYVFGVDGPDTQAFGDIGWDNGWNSSPEYGSAIPQAYGEVGYNNLSVKFGHFFTSIGYEVVQAPDNFFYSHAYTMYYGEPFTHTGALATYSGFDNLTLYGGWTNGWDTGFNDSANASTFLGGVGYTLGDVLTVTYMLSAGDWGTINGGDIYMHSIVVEMALAENLTWAIQNDLGVQSGLANAGENRWGGINQYLLYHINDQWGLGMRFEWFNDRDGSRGIGVAGLPGNYYNVTAGINWRPHANVVIRPELRVDWFGGQAAAGNLPFNNGQNDEQLSGGFDAIFTF